MIYALRLLLAFVLVLAVSLAQLQSFAAAQPSAEDGMLSRYSNRAGAGDGEGDGEGTRTHSDGRKGSPPQKYTDVPTINRAVDTSNLCQANAQNEFVFTVNLNQYQFEVEGCEGVAPTLEIQRGVEYTIVQRDNNNWYHPVGLAYYQDGALADNPELEEPTPSECDLEEYLCNPGEGVQQAPLYCINGVCEDINDWNNGETGGLDVYEPIFQRPEDQWEEEGGEDMYAVKITIPEDSLTQEFYYFCHIHRGMSGLIVVTDPAQDANELQEPLPADYYGPGLEVFDMECGTYDNVTIFHTDQCEICPDQQFLCDPTGSLFSKCMEAIDCKMNFEMRVVENESNKLAVFMEQMIPHHWNAILMSKIALEHATDSPGYDDEDLNVPALLRSIINVQMQQIQEMQGWLEKYSAPTVVCSA
jgi:hypothetical protein